MNDENSLEKLDKRKNLYIYQKLQNMYFERCPHCETDIELGSKNCPHCLSDIEVENENHLIHSEPLEAVLKDILQVDNENHLIHSKPLEIDKETRLKNRLTNLLREWEGLLVLMVVIGLFFLFIWRVWVFISYGFWEDLIDRY